MTTQAPEVPLVSPVSAHGWTIAPPTVPQARSLAPGGDDAVGHALRQPLDLMLARPGPLDWPAPLLAYQREGIRNLIERPGLLLADDMGLGKTIQAIAALRVLWHWRAIGAVLAIVPAGLLPQWRRELQRWAPELRSMTVQGRTDERAYLWPAPAHLHLVGYETFRSDWSESPRAPPRRRTWDVVILDEAQRIKNPDIDVSRFVKRLGRSRTWALTGTPLENRIDDVQSILEAVDPTAAADRDPDLAEIRHRLALWQVRRRKADVLPQLPPKRVVSVPLALSGAQRRAYDEAERLGIVRLRDRGEAATVANVLELILRLKQICNICPTSGRSAKLEDLDGRLDTLAQQGHRALIFSQFADDRFGVAMLARALARFDPVAYSGALTQDEREAAIRRFKGNPRHKAMILSLRAGGQGLNLQEASYVVHFDRWWNPATGAQAEDRAHRLGQAAPVTVYGYLVEGTIEQRIDEILRAKQHLFDEVVEGASDLQRTLTAEELFGLFGLSPPRRAGPGAGRRH